MKKMGVAIKNNALVINGKTEYVYSGEIHYFRIKKKDWLDRIRKAKKANLNTFSSYIPWRWHEPKEKSFDFTGKSYPERDLVYLLELLKKEKMYFIARIGPVCNGEIIDDGLPEWLFPSYPQLRLKNYAGRTNPYSSLIDYHSPDYHKLIKKWYSKLIPILEKYLISNGGPIILIQLDNEISMLNWLTKSPTYSAYSNNLFQNYLKDKYENILSLNKTFKTNYKSFKDIKQPEGAYDEKKGSFLYEWTDYYREFYALFYKKLYSYLKEYDIDLPVLANIPQIYDYDVKGRGNMGIMTTSMFKKFRNYVDKIIFGGAYQYRRLDYENFHDISAMTEVIRMITPENNPMICAEMQTGIMFDRPVLYPSDVALNIKTSLATGLNGINGYMFAGGENFLNMGGFGNFHNWQAAVGDDGSLAPHYRAVQEPGEVIKGLGPIIPESQNAPEVNIALYLPYYQTEYFQGDKVTEIMEKRDRKFFDGLLRLIKISGYNYKFIDIKDIDQKELNKLKNLWVFSFDFMDKNTQTKLVNFIKAGKNAFFYPTLPGVDLDSKKCEILKSYLGVKKIVHKQIGANRIIKPKSKYLYYGGDELFLFTPESKKDIKSIFYSEDNQLNTYQISKGKAKVILCGFDLTHKFDFQIEFIDTFAKMLGIKKEIKNANRRLNTILRKGEKADVLFVANYTEMDEKTKLNVKDNSFPIDMSVTIPGRKAYLLLSNYKVNKKSVIKYISAEVIKISKSKDVIKMTLRGINKKVEICYTGNIKLKTKEVKKVIKKSSKYNLVRISPKNDTFEISFKK